MAAWQASHVYAQGALIQPTPGTGQVYIASVGGTSNSTQPSAFHTSPYPTIGTLVTDNTVTWMMIQTVPGSWPPIIQQPVDGDQPIAFPQVIPEQTIADDLAWNKSNMGLLAGDNTWTGANIFENEDGSNSGVAVDAIAQTGSNNSAITAQADGTGIAIQALSGSGSSSTGVLGSANGTGFGIWGANSGSGPGVYGENTGGGPGVKGVGFGTGAGGTFTGGLTGAFGVIGTAATGSGGGGVFGVGDGSGAGVVGNGTGGGPGVFGTGGSFGQPGVQGYGGGASGTGGVFLGGQGPGSGNSDGVHGTGTGTGRGILGTGGTSGGPGVVGVGGGGNAVGGAFQGTGSGQGITAQSSGGYGAQFAGNSSFAALNLVAQAEPSNNNPGDIFVDSSQTPNTLNFVAASGSFGVVGAAILTSLGGTAVTGTITSIFGGGMSVGPGMYEFKVFVIGGSNTPSQIATYLVLGGTTYNIQNGAGSIACSVFNEASSNRISGYSVPFMVTSTSTVDFQMSTAGAGFTAYGVLVRVG